MFSGIGGFDLAAKRCGHEIIGACEIDKHARSIYSKHFPTVKIYKDATKIKPEELPDFDCLDAGFPCQTFSVAGKRLGFEESRGTLFFEIIRIAREKRPRLLLLENVKGLLNHDRGRTFRVILSALDQCGYDAQWQVCNSKYFVPQNRERVFIVCHLREIPRPKVFPFRENIEIHNETRKKTQGKRKRIPTQIAGALDANYQKGGGARTMIRLNNPTHSSNKLYDSDGIARTLTATTGGFGGKTGMYAVPILSPDKLKTRQNGRRFKTDGEPMFTLTAIDRHGIITNTNNPTIPVLNPLRKKVKINGRRLKTDGEESFTLTASGSHGVFNGKKLRRLTPIECERLQGFPDNYTKYGKDGELISDNQRYKCLGNAVTVPLVEFIMKRMVNS